MRIEVHNNLGNPQLIDCTRVLVRDAVGNPVCIILEHTPGHIFTSTVGEPEFDRALRLMGVEDTVLVDTFSKGDYPEPPGELYLPET
jgi:hypothetical protein